MNIRNLLCGEITQNDLLNYYNASVIYEELPNRIEGFVFNHDGINFILIDKKISYYKKKRTLIHELAHIELNQIGQLNNDLFAFYISDYEDEADKYIKFIKESVKEMYENKRNI